MEPFVSANDRSDWTPEMLEEQRLEELFSPLFDMWLAFEQKFGEVALDEQGVSAEDAETYASRFGAPNPLPAHQAFAYLVRHINIVRSLRHVRVALAAVFPQGLPEGGVSFTELGFFIFFVYLHVGPAALHVLF